MPTAAERLLGDSGLKAGWHQHLSLAAILRPLPCRAMSEARPGCHGENQPNHYAAVSWVDFGTVCP